MARAGPRKVYKCGVEFKRAAVRLSREELTHAEVGASPVIFFRGWVSALTGDIPKRRTEPVRAPFDESICGPALRERRRLPCSSPSWPRNSRSHPGS